MLLFVFLAKVCKIQCHISSLIIIIIISLKGSAKLLEIYCLICVLVCIHEVVCVDLQTVVCVCFSNRNQQWT